MLLCQYISRKKVIPVKTPVTRKKIQHHFTYSLWKYALLVIVAIFGWSLIFSVTEYQAPDEKKVVMGVYAYGDETMINDYMEVVRTSSMPDMEEMNAQYVTPDDAYGAMILSTRVAARDYDIYILPRAEFQSYAAQGAFMPLEIALPGLMADLEVQGVGLSRGCRTLEAKVPTGWEEHMQTGGKYQFGIPCAELPSMSYTLQIDASDMYICVFYQTGNDENVLKFLDLFVRDMLLEPVPAEIPAE